MGQKAKGGMWCATCNRPVMGVKNMHRIRNTLSVGAVAVTGGVSLAGSKVEGYVCPTCGSPVRPLHAASQPPLGAFLVLVGAAVLWVLVAIAAGAVALAGLTYRALLRRHERTPLEVKARSALTTAGSWVGTASRRLDQGQGMTKGSPPVVAAGPPPPPPPPPPVSPPPLPDGFLEYVSAGLSDKLRLLDSHGYHWDPTTKSWTGPASRGEGSDEPNES